MHTKILENIYWVGYVDWSVRDFHSYNTTRGATYNAYLIQDEKIALIDSVKAPYTQNLLNNISELTEISKIDYIICHHGEPDHSGAIPAVVKLCPDVKIVCCEKAVESLSGYYDTTGWNFEVVKTGDTLSLGKRTLSFLETKMVHWPDSLMSYIPEDKLLFSMDGFGQHYSSSARFDDEVNIEEVVEEAKTYYANIVMPYSKQVDNTLKAASELDIQMIAPAHGVIWRSNVKRIVEAYKEWAASKVKPKVVVIYDSMWDSTTKMATAIYEGVAQEKVEVKFLRIRSTGNTRIAAECLDAACIAVGSSTLNMTLMPAVASTITYLMGLRQVGKSGVAFGSFGWGKSGAAVVSEYLKKMNVEEISDPITAKWVPTDEILAECKECGKKLAAKALELASK